MNCVLYYLLKWIKFSGEKNQNNSGKKWRKKYWKTQGVLSVRKSGNHAKGTVPLENLERSCYELLYSVNNAPTVLFTKLRAALFQGMENAMICELGKVSTPRSCPVQKIPGLCK